MDETSPQQALYTIDGVGYRLETLSWQQMKWLGEHIFGGIDLQILEYRVVHDLLRERGPLMMAICLLPEGQTRAEQGAQPWAAIERLAARFAGALTAEEVSLFGIHFFRSCGPAQLALLVPGAALQRVATEAVQADASSAANGATGSNPASSPLPMVTSDGSA